MPRIKKLVEAGTETATQFQPEQYENTYFKWRGSEIRVGLPDVMKYPPDWHDEYLRTRAVQVFYWRPDTKSPWVLYRESGQETKTRPVYPDERAKCEFHGELVFLDKGEIKRRKVTRQGWDDNWNIAVHGDEPLPDAILPEGTSEFMQLARTAQLKQAERDKALAQRANEFEDAEMPEPPPFEDELGEPV